jgi:drug/metabolite transporter superfamily protein YnfA
MQKREIPARRQEIVMDKYDVIGLAIAIIAVSIVLLH